MHAGLAINLPDDGAIFLHRHAAFADIAVGADTDIEFRSVRTGCQRFGPVMIDARGQSGHLDARRGDARFALAIGKAQQRVLCRDIELALDQGEAIGRIQSGDECTAQFGAAIAIGIAQQGDAIATLYRCLPHGLDLGRDDILGPQGRGRTARPFRHQNVAIGQHQHLARDGKPRGKGRHGKAGRCRRLFIAPACGRRDFHRRQQCLALIGQVRPVAGLVKARLAAPAGGKRQETGAQDEGTHGHGRTSL
ncbi:hypothetical protein CP98_04104 [Sphingobium yanoikuyae]|uniref:Uncharacterized protein n=1 Tax=Sphingobium yanoikuyae TaxID=13690 RepID=A0A084EEM2_SPHYA|nr:hypothetical protein CP98_04104 [Sphingobium yanoikuyae]